jgi:hypothetical protein
MVARLLATLAELELRHERRGAAKASRMARDLPSADPTR